MYTRSFLLPSGILGLSLMVVSTISRITIRLRLAIQAEWILNTIVQWYVSYLVTWIKQRRLSSQSLIDGTAQDYDVAGHNCNFFTDDLIKSLGAPGLDQEYLNASGLAKGLRQIPGGTTVQELIVKWPITDKRLDQAFMDDLQRLARLPDDIRKEIVRFFDRIRFPWSW